MKKTCGITLIALVVTIIVLLILAGISITALFGENGIIAIAKNAKIKMAQAEKEEEVRLAITSLLLRNGYDESKVTVSAVVEKVKENYKDQKSKNSISGASNVESSNNFPGYIQYDKPSSTIDQSIVVSVDENLNVTSHLDEPEPPIELPDSEYEKVGDTYYNSPELSKFKPENTYYVTYDSNGENETVYGRIDKVKKPDNWYDYEDKRWANVVTVNGDDVTYWTWIPRYKYKITEGTEEVDIKFVDVNNNYQGKEEVDLTGYTLPESFTFDSQPLAGYWASKYEVQDSSSSGVEKMQIKQELSSIYIASSKINQEEPKDKYTIFLNGEKLIGGVTLPYVFEDTQPGTEYEICLVNETDRKMIGNTKETINDSSKNIEVDLSGFNPKKTYYITQDEKGENEKLGDKIELDGSGKATNIPDNWYNYDKKRWANVVTVNEDDVTYWTYIPRYEYRTYEYINYTDIRYIPVTQEKADEGYKLPESFTFDEKPLKGYWASKYEVQDSSSSGLEKLRVKPEPESSSIYITTTKPDGEYTIYVDGEFHKDKQTLPYHLPDVDLSKEHEILLYNDKDSRIIGVMTVRSNDTAKNIEVDLSGFNPDCTYYVTYDDNGESETIGDKIQLDSSGKPLNMPDNWYDYDKKRWANVVTKGKDETGKELIAYWTYIPRYEYKIYSSFEYTEVRYLKEGEEVEEGYKLPESFTFDGKPLKGYWASKYEVQQ